MASGLLGLPTSHLSFFLVAFCKDSNMVAKALSSKASTSFQNLSSTLSIPPKKLGSSKDLGLPLKKVQRSKCKLQIEDSTPLVAWHVTIMIEARPKLANNMGCYPKLNRVFYQWTLV